MSLVCFARPYRSGPSVAPGLTSDPSKYAMDRITLVRYEARREAIWEARAVLPNTHLPEFLNRTKVQVAVTLRLNFLDCLIAHLIDAVCPLPFRLGFPRITALWIVPSAVMATVWSVVGFLLPPIPMMRPRAILVSLQLAMPSCGCLGFPFLGPAPSCGSQRGSPSPAIGGGRPPTPLPRHGARTSSS